MLIISMIENNETKGDSLTHGGLHSESVLLLKQGQVARRVVLVVGFEDRLRHAGAAVVLVAGHLRTRPVSDMDGCGAMRWTRLTW